MDLFKKYWKRNESILKGTKIVSGKQPDYQAEFKSQSPSKLFTRNV